MSALRTVALDWAISSKVPRGVDFGVLRSSKGPSSYEIYQSLISAIDPGSPSDVVVDGAAAAPWLSMVTWTESGRDYIGVCVTERGEGSDLFNRAITAKRFFALDARDYMAALCSYQELWHAVRDLELPADGSGPISVQLPVRAPHDVSPVPNSVDAPGFRWLAGVAAALLDTGVVITGYQGTGVDSALGHFEAILSLLPSGYRAKMNLSTWTMNPDSEAQLAFGRNGGHHSVEVPWGQSEAISPERLSQNARGHYETLLELYREFQGDEQIVGGMRAASEIQLATEDRGRAQRIASRLDLVSVTHRLISNPDGAVRAKKSSSGMPVLMRELLSDGILRDVREVVDAVDYAAMRRERRGAFVDFLMLHPDQRVLENLPQSWWNAVVRRTADVVHGQLSRQPKSAGKIAEYIRRFPTAAERTLAGNEAVGEFAYDALWSWLFAAGGAEQSPAMQQVVFELWSDWSGRCRFDLPLTGRVLAERADMCRVLLNLECDVSGYPVELLRITLNRAEPDSWIRPLSLVLPGAHHGPSPDDCSRFAADHPDNAVLMLRLAGRSGHTDAAVAAVGDFALRQASAELPKGRHEVPRALARLIHDGHPADASMRSHAVLDAVGMLLGGDVSSTYLVGLRDHEHFEHYGAGLLQATANGFAATCQSTLAVTLTRAACTKPDGVPAWGEAVMCALLGWGNPETRRQVADLIGEVTQKNKNLSGDTSLRREFWDLVIEHASGDKRQLIQAQVHSDLSHAVKAGVEPDRLALICYRALQLGSPMREVLRHLAKWRWRTDIGHARDLFRRVDEAARDGAWTESQQAELEVIGGIWGSGPARLFHGQMLGEKSAQIEQARIVAAERKRHHETQLRRVDEDLANAENGRQYELAEAKQHADERTWAAQEQRRVALEKVQHEADQAMARIQRELAEAQAACESHFDGERTAILADSEDAYRRITGSWNAQIESYRETMRLESSALAAIDTERKMTEQQLIADIARADQALGRATGHAAAHAQPGESKEAVYMGVTSAVRTQQADNGETAGDPSDGELANPQPGGRSKKPGFVANLLGRGGKTNKADDHR